MGVARLLAKGWVVFCLYGGGLALAQAGLTGSGGGTALVPIAVAVFLFGAMGLLFIGGYGFSATHRMPRLESLIAVPGFNEIVFLCFVCLSFLVEIAYRPGYGVGAVIQALQAALRIVPGQHALGDALQRCNLDGGRTFAGAFAWLLAFIFVGSAVSRLRINAALVRLERKTRPEPLGPSGAALTLGTAAVVGIQFLFVGTLFSLLPCKALAGLSGALLIGLAPLALAYLAIAALTNLLAANPEG